MTLRELRITYHKRHVEADVPPAAHRAITDARHVATLAHALIGSESVEVIGMFLLDTKSRLIAWHELGRGTLDHVHVHPRDVIKAACLANAASVIIVHNHPSGEVEASPEDIAIFQRMRGVLEAVGIPLLDFVIVGDSPARFYSYRASVR